MINTLQFILHVPLFSMSLPANIMIVFQALFNMITFDYIDTNDNGKGFDITMKNNSLGLKNIEQRAFLAKIKYTFKSTLKKGTHMQIVLKQ